MVLAQSGLEYLWVYAITIIIALIVAFYIYSVFSSAQSILPSKCVFDLGIDCKGIIEASNSTSTMIALLGTNMQPYSIYNPTLIINQDGSSVSLNCSPSYVKPGQAVLCVGKLQKFQPVLGYSSGTAIMSAKYCGYNCNNGVVEERFVGNYSSNVKKLIVPKVSLVVNPLNNYAKSNQNITLNVGLNVFGYVLPVANPELISSNPSISIIYNAQNFSNGFITLTSNGTSGVSTVTVSYAGLTANATIVFIPAYPKLLIPNLLSSNLTIVNVSSGAAASFSNLTLPQSVAVSSNSTVCYVTIFGNKVKMLSIANGSTVGLIKTGSYPTAIIDVGKYLYIANSGSNNVTIASENGMIVSNIKVGIFPSFEAASGDGAYVFVLNQLSQNITILNSLNVIGSLKLSSMPYALASNYNGSIVFVTFPALNKVAAIYTKNNSILWQGYAGFMPFGIAYNSRLNRLYVTDVGTSSVAVLNASTGALIGSINVGFLPLFASTSGDGNYEYILNAGSSTLSIINATKGSVVAVYKTGLFPSWVAES